MGRCSIEFLFPHAGGGQSGFANFESTFHTKPEEPQTAGKQNSIACFLVSCELSQPTFASETYMGVVGHN